MCFFFIWLIMAYNNFCEFFRLDIFVCGDQIGAALNAVQIAEMLL